MIAAGLSNDPLGYFFFRKRKNRVRGSANFEGAGFLQVVTFEEEPGSGDGVERGRSQDWRTVNPRRNSRVGREDVVPARRLIGRVLNLWRSAHKVVIVAFGLRDYLLFSAPHPSVKEALWHSMAEAALPLEVKR